MACGRDASRSTGCPERVRRGRQIGSKHADEYQVILDEALGDRGVCSQAATDGGRRARYLRERMRTSAFLGGFIKQRM